MSLVELIWFDKSPLWCKLVCVQVYLASAASSRALTSQQTSWIWSTKQWVYLTRASLCSICVLEAPVSPQYLSNYYIRSVDVPRHWSSSAAWQCDVTSASRMSTETESTWLIHTTWQWPRDRVTQTTWHWPRGSDHVTLDAHSHKTLSVPWS